MTVWPFADLLEREKVGNTGFRDVDLSSHRWTGVTLNRCRFVGARLTGLAVSGASLSDVLFEDCTFDYAVLDGVRVTGDVAFVNCSFRESVFSGSDLGGAVFDGCALGAEFDTSRMRDADLRGSDLSGLSGLASLKGATVAEAQLRQLLDVMVGELRLTVAEADD
ncbi:pentapeptide repeat-containing protein [Actinorugispora endophytica]|uniref:pentapeptide repeat-containing protein n=1 Tax=Actinorugispora endophytica TaxID=1605990 RepID=UPI001FB6CC88|nr:pentapeptide repeat-containing protein [Actinorugispora endophytica]